MKAFRAIPFFFGVALSAGVFDQIAVTVGNQAITESEITDDLKLSSWLNGTALDNSTDARRASAARLIEQALVRREMSFGSYPPAPAAQIDSAVANVEKQKGGPAAVDESLKQLHLTRDELREYLTWQVQLLRFIDMRFRPAVQVTREDIEKYYQDNVVAAQPSGKPPELSAVQDQIEQKLSGERVDEQLDRWIKQSRSRAVIRYPDQSLAPH